MGTSAGADAEGAAGAAGAAAATDVVETRTPIQVAADAGRELLAKAAEAGEVVPPVNAAETPEEIATREAAETADAAAAEAALVATETPEETAARHAAAEEERQAALRKEAAASGAPLVVKLPGQRDGEEIDIEVGDQETFDALNRLNKGYARREAAEAIRDQAYKIREESDNIRYAAELDPAEIVLTAMQNTADVDHLARYLLTRDGALERLGDWIRPLLENPESIGNVVAQVELERRERRDAVKGEIAEKMTFDDNARKILGTMRKSIESLAPDSIDEDGRSLLERDIRSDMINRVNAQVNKYIRDNNIPLDRNGRPTKRLPIEVRTLDPREVPGLIQRRFKLMGVAPKSATAPVAKAPPAPATPAVVKAPLTADALKAARVARRAAGSAPVGAGSLVATLEKPPAYDPKQPGNAIQQAGRWGRERLKALTSKPQ